MVFGASKVIASTYTRTTPSQTNFETSGFSTLFGVTDDNYVTVNMGFSFPMPGNKSFSSVNINTNGALTFPGEGAAYAWYTNRTMYDSGFRNDYRYFIAPFWDDLYPRGSGQMRYKSGGSGSNRYFVVWYNNIQRYSPSYNTHNFQVVLYENGDIRFRYDPTNTSYDEGQSATIGVYVSDTDFDQFSYNSGSINFSQDIVYSFSPPPQVDHYRIEYPSSAVTCEPALVTIKACEDAACSQLFTDSNSTLTLSPTTSWIGGNTVNFNGFITKQLNINTVQTVNLAITANAPTPDNGYQCYKGGARDFSCSLSFSDSAFIFYSQNSAINQIENITAGLQSGTHSLKAVTTNPNTGACTSLFANQTVPINFGYQCINPSSCSSGNQYRLELVNNNQTHQLPVNALTPLPIRFDLNAEAAFNLMLPDAGSLTLTANYQVPSGPTLEVTSNTFVSTPGICIESVTTNSECTNSSSPQSCSKFIPAGNGIKSGQGFDLRVKAVTYNTSSQTNSELCANTVTPNFRFSNLPLSHIKLAPTGSDFVNGTITHSSVDISTNGSTTLANFNYSEVGVIQLSSGSINYQGTLINSSSSAAIGRFYPAHFDLAITPTTLQAECNSFSFVGQELKHDSPPTLQISARNIDNQITKNYQGVYALLTAADIDIAEPTSNQIGKDNLNTLVVSETVYTGILRHIGLQNGTDNRGVFEFSKNINNRYVFEKNENAEISPFLGTLNFLVSNIEDSDGVQLSSTLSDDDKTIVSTGTEIKFGRIKVNDSFGTETDELGVNIVSEYLATNGQYIVNVDDNCNQNQLAAISILDGDSGDSLTPSLVEPLSFFPNSGMFINGVQVSMMKAPYQPGLLQFQLDLSSTPWLMYDWNANSSLENPPAAKVVFGAFRGNDRIIYRRELGSASP